MPQTQKDKNLAEKIRNHFAKTGRLTLTRTKSEDMGGMSFYTVMAGSKPMFTGTLNDISDRFIPAKTGKIAEMAVA